MFVSVQPSAIRTAGSAQYEVTQGMKPPILPRVIHILQ
jgi:hypothetical protein